MAASLILLTLVIYGVNVVQLLPLAFQEDTTLAWSIILIALPILFVLLNGFAAWGLWLMKNWGFTLAYIAIIFSTICLSVSYIPLVVHLIDKLLPYKIRFLPLIIVNIIFLIYLVYLHVSLKSKNSDHSYYETY